MQGADMLNWRRSQAYSSPRCGCASQAAPIAQKGAKRRYGCCWIKIADAGEPDIFASPQTHGYIRL
jgi:hypothetical protein